MKKYALICSSIIIATILFVSCNGSADYKSELSNNSSNYNTIVPLMTKVHTSAVLALSGGSLSSIRSIIDSTQNVLNERISALETNQSSDKSIKEMNDSQLEYLKAEKNMIDEYIKLCQRGGQLSQDELSPIMDKLRGMDEIVTEKLTTWESIQSQFREKHQLTEENEKK